MARTGYTGGASPWVAGSTLAYRRDVVGARLASRTSGRRGRAFLWTAAPQGASAICATRGCAWHRCTPGNIEPRSRPAASSGSRRARPSTRCRDDCTSTRGLPPAAPIRRPLVSCIMPTCDRRGVRPARARVFPRQDYPNRELIVVDDGDDPVGDLVRGRAGVRYVRSTGRTCSAPSATSPARRRAARSSRTGTTTTGTRPTASSDRWRRSCAERPTHRPRGPSCWSARRPLLDDEPRAAPVDVRRRRSRRHARVSPGAVRRGCGIRK